MGGDHGPSVIVPAALKAKQQNPEAEFHLVGDKDQITAAIRRSSLPVDRHIHIHHASEVIGMDEKPSSVVRAKPDASMRVALNLLRDGTAHACVSAGNTGALMALACLIVKTLPGVNRPAIIAELPSHEGHTYLLDLGANIDCSAEDLFSFAIMGSILKQAIDNRENPGVALLNVGEEDIKGNATVKAAAAMLEACPDINYAGYAEGRDLFTGRFDVVVCDGFTGNNVLKACEGVTRFLYNEVKAEFSRKWWHKLAALLVKPVLKSVQHRINPDQYNGASLLGLREIVVKSHGSANIDGTVFAIHKALVETEQRIPARIGSEIEKLLANRATA